MPEGQAYSCRGSQRNNSPLLPPLGTPALRALATARSELAIASGTCGKLIDGFDVTDSLPIPRLTGVFAGMDCKQTTYLKSVAVKCE